MKGINNNAPVKCSKTIVINTRPENVWAVLTNINSWAAWQTDISRAQLNGQLQPNTTFDWKTAGARIHSTLHTVERFNCLGWTGKTFGMQAIHNWKFTEVSGQTRLEVDESMEGLLASLFKKSFNKNLEKGMEKWLHLLKATCEKNFL